MTGYREAMVARHWRYHKEAFRDRPEIFEHPEKLGFHFTLNIFIEQLYCYVTIVCVLK
jgi:hypothetical protein